MAQDPPHGQVIAATLPPGQFYPGTPHAYSIYIPAQYNANHPIPFTVFMDGASFLREPIRTAQVLDQLIAEHAIPAMIGIFVDPGVLPAISPSAQNRYERSFEYDALSDRYSRFLLEELIPAVATHYRLSTSPDDRALAGISTGAAAAFIAAWNRPDQFHRVISFIGTYVAMRGADSLPALVRKTEPRPLRVYLEDGSNDHIVAGEPYGTFYAGSWPINNQVMLEDLEFGGYDVKLTLGQGGHEMKGGAAILTDALRWMWRDYPQPIVPHAPKALNQPGWDSRGSIFSTILPDEPWQPVGTSSVSSIGVHPSGDVIVADAQSGSIQRLDSTGTTHEIAHDNGNPTALTVGADGRIFVYQRARRKIVAYRSTVAEDVATGVDVAEMTITQKGRLYFSDPAQHRLGYVDTAHPSAASYTPLAMDDPAGVTLSPDQAMLVVTDAKGRYSWSFQLGPDGRPRNGEPFYRLEVKDDSTTSEVRGVVEDSIGQVYFGTPLGVQVTEASGRVAMILNGPEYGAVGSLRFAGPHYDWLYAIHKGKLYRRHLRTFGVAVDAPKKPPLPPL
ncbi:gluconolactonase [Granulicella sp. WH15]|uniref:alpha/beta hydrolase-fold protein n=1 Tax=Granulicella sp. WH15 TaxID=2602070 RepID=UPI00136708D6|nr:alpha/beta hydrolase-fold protein [Granulicella sp. WH15]QHN02045.1 gluconolactonase [Granulicella sp. WH15]